MVRGALCVHRTERQRPGDRSRDHRILRQRDVWVEDTEGRGVRPYSENIDGQDSEIHVARPGQFGKGDFGLSVDGYARIDPRSGLQEQLIKYLQWGLRTSQLGFPTTVFDAGS